MKISHSAILARCVITMWASAKTYKASQVRCWLPTTVAILATWYHMVLTSYSTRQHWLCQQYFYASRIIPLPLLWISVPWSISATKISYWILFGKMNSSQKPQHRSLIRPLMPWRPIDPATIHFTGVAVLPQVFLKAPHIPGSKKAAPHLISSIPMITARPTIKVWMCMWMMWFCAATGIMQWILWPILWPWYPVCWPTVTQWSYASINRPTATLFLPLPPA